MYSEKYNAPPTEGELDELAANGNYDLPRKYHGLFVMSGSGLCVKYNAIGKVENVIDLTKQEITVTDDNSGVSSIKMVGVNSRTDIFPITIAGIFIGVHNGLYSLTDVYRASKLLQSNNPNLGITVTKVTDYLRLQKTKSFIQQLILLYKESERRDSIANTNKDIIITDYDQYISKVGMPTLLSNPSHGPDIDDRKIKHPDVPNILQSIHGGTYKGLYGCELLMLDFVANQHALVRLDVYNYYGTHIASLSSRLNMVLSDNNDEAIGTIADLGNETYTIQQAAHKLASRWNMNVGTNKLFSVLRKCGLLKQGRDPLEHNLPYQQYVDTGMFSTREYEYYDGSIRLQTLITERGLQEFGQELFTMYMQLHGKLT